jgi:hypothetical protein
MSGKGCIACGSSTIECLIDFGPQPPSNRFQDASSIDREVHPLVVGQCVGCALVQLLNPMAPQTAKSRFSWLAYNEPEGHLDALVERLRSLPGLSASSEIRGLTYKDDSTLNRFSKRGYGGTSRFDPNDDFDINDDCAGLETIQRRLTVERARRLAAVHGRVELLLVRHVLEHAHDPQEFLQALGELIALRGHIVLEMPDCTKFLEACDYSFVWEEHITYFSPATLRDFVTAQGFDVVEVLNYEYPLEDSLVVVLRRADGKSKEPKTPVNAKELERARAFRTRFPEIRDAVRQQLTMLRNSGDRVAVFGAGHLAAKFLNVFDLKGLVDCVIDDNPHKQRLHMPGSGLPILGSDALAESACEKTGLHRARRALRIHFRAQPNELHEARLKWTSRN